MTDTPTELDHYAYAAESDRNSRVKDPFNGGRRGAMITAWLAILMLTIAGCSTARPAVATEAHVSHLIAEEIMLVDKHGKPWLRIGPRNDTELQGIQILSEIGEPALMFGILKAEVPNSAAQVDQVPASGSETELIPAIGLYSPNGEGMLQLLAHDSGASLDLGRSEMTSIQLGVDGDEAWTRASPEASFDDAEQARDADPKSAARMITIRFSAETMLLIITAGDGARKEIDLRALIK